MQIIPLYFYTYISISVVCIVSGIIIYSQMSQDMGSQLELRRFKYFIIFYMIFVASNIFCVWSMFNHKAVIGTIASAINISSVCVCVFEWFLYIETKLESRFTNNIKALTLALLPLIIMILIICTSHYTHLVYYYDESGIYNRGRLYVAILFMSGIYLIYASTHLIMRMREATTPSKKSQYRLLSLFIIFPLIAGLVDLFIESVPIMELTSLLGIVTVFTSMQQDQIYIDTLTGLNNRRSADEFLGERLHFASEENPLYYFIFDVDNFKNINDTYGHTEGDTALKIVANVLVDYSRNSDSYVARWGGDEFVAIHEGEMTLPPEEVVKHLNNFLGYRSVAAQLQYSISLSGGFYKCTDKKQNADLILMEADEILYKNKKEKKVGR